jgi:hypothetical protein
LSDDKQWIKWHDEAPPFDQYRTRPIVNEGSITYNSITKEWAFISTDTFGNYSVSTSPGWNGNKLAFTDVLTKDRSVSTVTFDKKSDTEFGLTVATRSTSGTTETVQGSCKKSG